MDILELRELLRMKYQNTFEFHPKFYEEFVECVRRSGSEKQILKQFIRRLNAIILLGDIDSGLKWLEKLKEYDNMYSLHLDEGATNYRLLFSKTSRGKLFLRMFYEKKGKDATSYKKNVPIAIQRLND